MSGPDEAAVERVERWFVGRGIPHFIADYSASRDVFTRAAPLLSVVFVVEMIGAADRQWPGWVNALAVAGGLALLLGALVGSNLARGRPPFSQPATVGVPDLTLFVVGPALLPLVFGGRVGGAAATAAANLAVLAAVYLVTSYGVVPMTRWGIGRVARQAGDLIGLLVRALPLLLLFVTFLFINAEVWQVAASLDGPFFWATLGLFFAVGTLFIVTRLPREVGDLATFGSEAHLRELVAATPAARLATHGALTAPRLSRREWGNVGLVVLFSQGLQILFVTVIIAAFFVVFGVVGIDPSVVEAWTGEAPNRLATLELWGREVPVSEELLRVAGFLGTFSGLYFTVVALTDDTYRREFYEEVVGEVREAFAVRAVYRANLAAPARAPSA